MKYVYLLFWMVALAVIVSILVPMAFIAEALDHARESVDQQLDSLWEEL